MVERSQSRETGCNSAPRLPRRDRLRTSFQTLRYALRPNTKSKDHSVDFSPPRRPSFYEPGGAASTAGREPPARYSLMGLPREIRDLIFAYVFSENGHNYIRNQLLGYSRTEFFTYSEALEVLLTCRQIYAECFPIAYRLTCFFWSKSQKTSSLEGWTKRLQAAQLKNIRSLAFWSNPYLLKDFVNDIPSFLNLKHVTVCCNFMSGPIPIEIILNWRQWILKHIRQLKTLKSFHFLTGCSIVRGARDSDCDFASDLRYEMDDCEFSNDPVFGSGEIGAFDNEKLIAQVKILPEDEGREAHTVELKIASVFETGYTCP